MKQPLSGIVEMGKTVIFRGNFTWRLAMVILGPIMLGFSIRVSHFPAEFNICKAIILLVWWIYTRERWAKLLKYLTNTSVTFTSLTV